MCFRLRNLGVGETAAFRSLPLVTPREIISKREAPIGEVGWVELACVFVFRGACVGRPEAGSIMPTEVGLGEAVLFECFLDIL